MKLGGVLKIDKENLINIKDSTEYIIAGVQNYGKGVLNKRTVRGNELNMKKYQLIKENQLMWCKVDTKNGAFGITTKEHIGSLASTNMCLANIDIKKVKVEFLQLLFTQPSFYNNITSKSTGTTNRQYLTPVQLLEEIIIPDLSITEQEKFMLKFDKIISLNLFQELQHQSDLIKKLRQSVLQDAVQGKLSLRAESSSNKAKEEDAQHLLQNIKAEKQKLIAEGKLKKEKELPPISPDEIPFELPKGWAWCRFGEIALVDSGSTPDKKEFTENPNDIPYLKVYNLVKQKVNFNYKPQYIRKECHNGQLKRSICKSGNVLMNIVGPPLGKVAIVPDEISECNINQAIVVFRPFEPKLNKWIYHYLCEQSAINSIVTKGTAGQDNISLTQSRELLIPLPPLSKQEFIVAKVEELMQICDALEKEVEQSKTQLQHLMQSVLREAFEGKGGNSNQGSKTKVIELKPKKCSDTDKAILAGYIINSTNNEDFGRVKFQKLLYLTEHVCKLNLGSNYLQNVAGPYDGALIKEVESSLKRLRFYEIGRSQTSNKVNYTPLGAAAQLGTYFKTSFPTELEPINALLKKFKKSTWDQTEIVATLYAVWNNRILKQETITDELLKKDFLEWDPQKKKYKDRLDDALLWMRNKNIVPDGWGKIISK